jgi:hypothetical protein
VNEEALAHWGLLRQKQTNEHNKAVVPEKYYLQKYVEYITVLN